MQTRYAHSTRTREAVADFFPAGIHRAAGRVPAARPHHRTSSHGQHKADRGAIVEAFLNEKTDTVVDELEIIAKAHKTTVATVALAWVHAQPAVTSVIIGARRLAQLAEEISRLSALTEPSFGFPRTVLTTAQSVINNGATINGVSAPISEYVIPQRSPALPKPVRTRRDSSEGLVDQSGVFPGPLGSG